MRFSVNSKISRDYESFNLSQSLKKLPGKFQKECQFFQRILQDCEELSGFQRL